MRNLDDYIDLNKILGDKDMVVDLHTHSRYSRATSRNMTLKAIASGARLKGVQLLGTGDCLHPKWIDELKGSLVTNHDGLYVYQGVLFVPTTEVNLSFSKEGKPRRIHLLLLLPDLEIAQQIGAKLLRFGDLSADGRPTLRITPPELLEILIQTDRRIEPIPAHIWTPWFSVLGATNFFNSIEECFEERSDLIHSLETGLSSDPEMNWMLSALDKYNLLSNSDAHSHHPWRLGREANVFSIKPAFDDLLRALRTGKGLKLTLEVPPEFGKYHWSGHRSCSVSMPPKLAIESGNRCPVCGGMLTIGVEQRVFELADRKKGYVPPDKPGFIKTLPLHEILMKARGSSTYGSVSAEYEGLIQKYGTEYEVLLNAPLEELNKLEPAMARLIHLLRSNTITVTPGYDGVYGVISS